MNEALEDIILKITCPALILAANRKAKVIGRINDLKVSTNNKNLAIIGGVFGGKKCAIEFFILIIIEIITILNQKGTLNDNEVNRWEVIDTV